MDLDCPHLSLAPSLADKDDRRNLALVRAIDALRLCRDGGFEEAGVSVASWAFEEQCQRLIGKVRELAVAARVASPYSTRFEDDDLVELVRDAIERGDLVGVKKKREGPVDSDATRTQRRLAGDIESRSRGRLSIGSRQYKLVAGLDLPGISDRNSYEVVARGEARRVLDELTQQGAANLAALLKKARDGLAADWQPPLSPNGLVLLRKTYAPQISVASQEPALTPSQLWGRGPKEKDDIIDWTIWIELDRDDPKASDDVVILIDGFHQEIMRKPLASCPRQGSGVLVVFEKINKNEHFSLIRDYGPNEGGGQDTLFIDSSPAEMDERGRQASD